MKRKLIFVLALPCALFLTSCEAEPHRLGTVYDDYPYLYSNVGYFEAPSCRAISFFDSDFGEGFPTDEDGVLTVSFSFGSFIEGYDFGIAFSASYIPYLGNPTYSDSFVSSASFGSEATCTPEEFEAGEPNPIDVSDKRILNVPFSCFAERGEVRFEADFFLKDSGRSAFRVSSFGTVGYSGNNVSSIAFCTPFFSYKDNSIIEVTDHNIQYGKHV